MKVIDNIVKIFLVLTMAVITFLTSYQIFMRFVMNNASSWSEEMTRLIFVWSSFIAAGVGIKDHIHVGINAVVNLFPPKVQKIFAIAVSLAEMIFGIWLAHGTYGLMLKTTKQLSAALKYPKPLLYASVLVFGILCAVYGLREAILIIKDFNKIEEKKSEQELIDEIDPEALI